MTVAAPALAPDRVFPRRDDLLDDDLVRGRLCDLLGAGIERCDRVRVTYHPGRSLRVLLRVEVEAGTRTP